MFFVLKNSWNKRNWSPVNQVPAAPGERASDNGSGGNEGSG
jgi:hypothetical protein